MTVKTITKTGKNQNSVKKVLEECVEANKTNTFSLKTFSVIH